MNACRSANLRVLLQDQEAFDNVNELVRAFETVIGTDRRGSRLSDLRNPSQHLQVPGKRKFEELEAPVFSAFLEWSTVAGTPAPHHPPSRNTYTYSKLVISGVQFKIANSSEADSYIMCEREGVQYCGRIRSIFLPPGQEDTATILLAVQRYTPLSEEDKVNDPYRLWGFAGGELFYDRFLEDYLIIEPEEVIGHIAKTQLGNVFGIDDQCVHVLPLDQVTLTPYYANPCLQFISSGLTWKNPIAFRHTAAPNGRVWNTKVARYPSYFFPTRQLNTNVPFCHQFRCTILFASSASFPRADTYPDITDGGGVHCVDHLPPFVCSQSINLPAPRVFPCCRLVCLYITSSASVLLTCRQVEGGRGGSRGRECESGGCALTDPPGR